MTTIKPVYVLNGPNLNLLGLREPEVYGTTTLEDIAALCRKTASTHGLSIEFRQSNHEGQLIDWIHEARASGSAILINAGAFTHTSIAIHDALKACELPVFEVHLSNIFAREPFRHVSHISGLAVGMITGLGANGYALALSAIADYLGRRL